MWGRHHLYLNITTLLIFAPLLFSLAVLLKISPDSFSILIISVPLFFVLGSLLPDADSENKGSKIFYTPFAIIGIIINYCEKHIAKILGFNVGHRKSLHSVKGILLNPLIVSLIFTIILLAIGKFNFSAVFYSYIILVVAQLLHILQDKIDNALAFFGLLVLLAIIVYGFSYQLVAKNSTFLESVLDKSVTQNTQTPKDTTTIKKNQVAKQNNQIKPKTNICKGTCKNYCQDKNRELKSYSQSGTSCSCNCQLDKNSCRIECGKLCVEKGFSSAKEYSVTSDGNNCNCVCNR